jgi:sugar/nucleoside kinase (ribokinase family)
VKVDVVCAGAPFLDLTIAGLPRIPALGEELVGERLEVTAGGMAHIALGLRRLGLRAAVCSPVGTDLAGTWVRRLLEDDGIDWIGPETDATPVSVVVPVDGERAFLTVDPELPVDGGLIARLEPRAVVVDLAAADAVTPGPAVYAVIGDVDAHRLAGRIPAAADRLTALLVNRREALALTGARDEHEAARSLAERIPVVVVTCGADGAVGVGDGEVRAVRAPQVEVVDTTGAGDLFTAAYVWADLEGNPFAERLRLATAYATLSVRARTAPAGAADRAALDEFLEPANPQAGRRP